MAVRGYKFYLQVLLEILSAREDKIRIPKRSCNIQFILSIPMKFPGKTQLFYSLFKLAIG